MDKTQLIESSVAQKLGILSRDGALMVRTGSCTGRSTKERFVVKHPEIASDIDWGGVNQPVDPQWAGEFFSRLQARLSTQPTFKMQGFVGCFSVTVTSTSPWHIAFAQNMFRDSVIASLKEQISDDVHVEIYHEPDLKPKDLGLEWPFERAIILDPRHMKVGIVGTAYAGEIKKSAFTLCNFALPKYDILPMHSSANCKVDGQSSCVLFGLSGTGKTTLSADPHRYLIGDDEIVWSNRGLSNLEGGCYAKLIHLDPRKEPEIYRAANRPQSILENVVFNPDTREVDFDDDSITENTRASYSIKALKEVFDQSVEAQSPQCVVFLTADAFGALPAVARLDLWQAQYHFISGYTAKVAGTEVGVTEPKATFSACFGAPFMPRSPAVYASLLAEKVKQSGASVWLLNTGWTNGGYGQGERFPIAVSRQILSAIQSGELAKVEMKKHPVFGFEVPVTIPGIDPQYLKGAESAAVFTLAQRFIANAKANKSAFTDDIIELGGPIISH